MAFSPVALLFVPKATACLPLIPLSFPACVFLPKAVLFSAVAFVPSPQAVEFFPEAFPLFPKAVLFSFVALVLFPQAVAFSPAASPSLPKAVLFSPVAFVPSPQAVAFVPEASTFTPCTFSPTAYIFPVMAAMVRSRRRPSLPARALLPA